MAKQTNTSDSPNNYAAVIPTRICASYDPAPFMREFSYDNGNRELYLEVKFRVDWFLHWCQENGVTGRIMEHEIQFVPEIRMALCTCSIQMDGEEVARSTAGRMITDDPKEANIAIQTAFTAAKGRALANLGFGTVNGNSSENGEPFPPDAGIPLPRVTPETNPMVFDPEPQTMLTVNPEPVKRTRQTRKVTESHTEQPAPRQTPVEEPVKERPQVAEQTGAAAPIHNGVVIPATLEEARAFICPVGISRGLTMGEIELRDPDKVSFFASEQYGSKDRHPDLVAAAELIVKARN